MLSAEEADFASRLFWELSAGIACWHFGSRPVRLSGCCCLTHRRRENLQGHGCLRGGAVFCTSHSSLLYLQRKTHHHVPLAPVGAGPAVSVLFGRTSASISITDLIKTDLLARSDPRLCVVCARKILCRNSHCYFQRGSPTLPRETDACHENLVSNRHEKGTVTCLLRTKAHVHGYTPSKSFWLTHVIISSSPKAWWGGHPHPHALRKKQAQRSPGRRAPLRGSCVSHAGHSAPDMYQK